MLVFIRSRICLLTLPISDLAGLIRRQVGLLAKFGLWSLRVMKASRLAVALMRSSNCSFLAMHWASQSIGFVTSEATFLVGLGNILLQEIIVCGCIPSVEIVFFSGYQESFRLFNVGS